MNGDFSDLQNWAAAHLDDTCVKAIVGVRGANKTGALETVRNLIRARGVDEARLVSLDFEDVRFRHLKTADDVLAFLRRLPGCAVTRYLFLDEISRVGAHAELLHRLHELPAWNVWVASSTATAVGAADEAFRPYPWVCAFRLWPDPSQPRATCVLERVWCEIFLRDVACCVNHPDIRAKEALAEYLSDHLGERVTLREVAAGLRVGGRAVAANSIRTYRRALELAYLVEASEVFDVFEKCVIPKCGVRLFYTDLELRAWRFGVAPTFEAERVAVNELYLKLRRTYEKVYTPHGKEADFVTVEPDGGLRYWNVISNKTLDIFVFRAVSGGGGGIFPEKDESASHAQPLKLNICTASLCGIEAFFPMPLDAAAAKVYNTLQLSSTRLGVDKDNEEFRQIRFHGSRVGCGGACICRGRRGRRDWLDAGRHRPRLACSASVGACALGRVRP